MTRLKKELIEWVATIAAAFAIAFLINMFGGLAIVDGSSMDTTLHDKDILLRVAYRTHIPERGDIIAFEVDSPHPRLIYQKLGRKKALVKRVIGIPGDKIVISDGQVFRNGEKLAEPYIHGTKTIIDTDIVVPPDHFFVMGDNREISHDSRYSDVGCISVEKVIGKTDIRLFPFNKFGKVNE